MLCRIEIRKAEALDIEQETRKVERLIMACNVRKRKLLKDMLDRTKVCVIYSLYE